MTPVSGTILPGANTVLTITLDAASLAAGSYSSSLVITSNAANTPSLSVPVSFTVEALPYPANPRFVAEWEPAQGAIVRYPLPALFPAGRYLRGNHALRGLWPREASPQPPAPSPPTE